MAGFLNQWIVLTTLLIVPAAASAAEINAIDLQGNVFSIDTSSGSYTQLGSSSLLFAHSLSRTPDGALHVIASEGGSTQLFEIDGQSYQPVLPGIEIVLDRNGGGLAFSSNAVGYSVGRVVGPHPILTRIELDSRTSSSVDFIQSDFDLSGLVFRDDGMLMSVAMDYNGVPGQQATLVEINPSDASIRTIAALSGMSARELGGLVITNEGAYFVGARETSDVSEIWSIDLYTGQHSLRSTVTGIVGLSGVAAPIPEPSVALLLGLGLVALAAQRRRISALWIVPLAVAIFASSPVVAQEIGQLVETACLSGELTAEACEQLRECLDDPGECENSSTATESSLMASSMSESTTEEGPAALFAVTGTSLRFRADRTQSPMLSPNGTWISFDSTSGSQRTRLALFGDGTASGSAITFPSGPTSSLNAGVDDAGLVSATAAQTSAPQS
jgi:PEP-CTERM motif